MSTPYVVIVHRPTLRAFTLNRAYDILNELTNVNIADIEDRAMDTWDGYEYNPKPDWAKKLLEDDFTAYWLE